MKREADRQERGEKNRNWKGILDNRSGPWKRK
jgi:hypothetical protein